MREKRKKVYQPTLHWKTKTQNLQKMGKNDEQTELCHNAILKNQARYTTIPCNKTEIAKQMRDLTLEWTIAHVVIKCNILF